jgi:Phosphotransferase enzyme family
VNAVATTSSKGERCRLPVEGRRGSGSGARRGHSQRGASLGGRVDPASASRPWRNSGRVDHAVEEWIRAHVQPIGPIEAGYERPWSTVLRVPIADGVAWFKTCAPVSAFEPRLAAALFARWSDRVAEVIGHDDERAWLLTTDAGTPMRVSGNPPGMWLAALPLYAELQRSEVAYADDHLAHRVPDMRLPTLPARFETLIARELPLEEEEADRLRQFAPRLADLCDELAAYDVPDSIQHDDLHHANVYERDGQLRFLDWGDACVSHPFMSLVVTFRFLDEQNKLPPDDPWFTRLRDAYLEPWGNGQTDAFELAIRVGAFAHAIAWLRQRDYLPDQARPDFDRWFRVILRRAVAHTRA